MSIHKLPAALQKGATGYCLYPISSNESKDTQEDPAIAALLKEFADVFEEPVGLPPVRDCDHSIPLNDGIEPPRIRPYKVPHK